MTSAAVMSGLCATLAVTLVALGMMTRSAAVMSWPCARHPCRDLCWPYDGMVTRSAAMHVRPCRPPW